MIIKNGLVFLLEAEGFVKKDLEMVGGKITAIADALSGEEEMDASGKYITPGLIDAHSHIGMWEEGMGWEGEDGNEGTDPVTPMLRGLDAINPMDEAFQDALKGGVTVASTGPGSGNVIGGQFVTLKLAGNIVDDMVLVEPAAIKCAFGENPKRFYGKNGKAPMTRMAVAGALRKALNDAKNYRDRKEHNMRDEEESHPFDMDLNMEALLPVIDGEIPLKAHAHRADDICTAIRIAKEFNVKLTLEHCTEGHLIAEHIKKSGCSAMVGPSFGSKSKIELNQKTFETAKILAEAGVLVSIITDHPVIPQSALVMCAAMAVKAGMKEFDAFKAITINPAKVLEIDDCKGQIKKGMDADLVIWDRHPMDLQAKAAAVYLEGKLVHKSEN